MTQRERLVTAILALGKMLSDIPGILKLPTDKQLEIVAECLLKIGVILPPCKVGQTVYQTDGFRVYESVVRNVIYDTDGIAFDDTAIGHWVFLTREDAEEESKKRSKL